MDENTVMGTVIAIVIIGAAGYFLWKKVIQPKGWFGGRGSGTKPGGPNRPK